MMKVIGTVIALALLAGCSSGTERPMDSREAGAIIERTLQLILASVPPDAPPATSPGISEATCGDGTEATAAAGVDLGLVHRIGPVSPELAERTMEALVIEVQRQGFEIVTDNRARASAPSVQFVRPDDDFRVSVLTAIPGTGVSISMGSPCVAPAR